MLKAFRRGLTSVECKKKHIKFILLIKKLEIKTKIRTLKRRSFKSFRIDLSAISCRDHILKPIHSCSKICKK